MNENYYTPYEYFEDELSASKIAPDSSASTVWDYADVLCKLYSLALNKPKLTH